MFRASGELWVGANYLPHGWVPARSTLEGVRATDAQIAGILCHHETIFGLHFLVLEDDALALLANSYYGSNLPGRGNPDYSTDLDTVIEVRSKLGELGLILDPVYYFHLAEAYIPLEAEAAWQYATRREFELLIDNQKAEARQVPPSELGLTSWADAASYLEAAWRKSVEQSDEQPPFSTVPDRWFAAAIFPNSD